jgi:uncharacterized protein
VIYQPQLNKLVHMNLKKGEITMNSWITVVIIFLAAIFQASDCRSSDLEVQTPCSESWYRFIEEKITTSDSQAHGPDVGSDEWKSVVEFKLGIRGKPNLPARDSKAWCDYIDQIVRKKYVSLTNSRSSDDAANTIGPSYDCAKVKAGSIEEMICKDDELSALDRKLSRIYSEASKKATNEHPAVLTAEQRGWIKGRNECWKSDDKRICVRDEYQRRIAELQARYRLISGNGPHSFICNGNSANEVVVTFFQTDPPTLIAEHGDSVSMMYLQPSGSGTKYQGRNETFWEHQGQARIVWGYKAPEMTCSRKK